MEAPANSRCLPVRLVCESAEEGACVFGRFGLFEKIVSSAILPLFTLLQRSFLLFFPAIIGAVVIIQLLRKQTMAVAQQEPEEEKDRSTPLSL